MPRWRASFQNSIKPRPIAAAANATNNGCNHEIQIDAIRIGSAMAAVMMRFIKTVGVLEFLIFRRRPVSDRQNAGRVVDNQPPPRAGVRGESPATVFR